MILTWLEKEDQSFNFTIKRWSDYQEAKTFHLQEVNEDTNRKLQIKQWESYGDVEGVEEAEYLWKKGRREREGKETIKWERQAIRVYSTW